MLNYQLLTPTHTLTFYSQQFGHFFIYSEIFHFLSCPQTKSPVSQIYKMCKIFYEQSQLPGTELVEKCNLQTLSAILYIWKPNFNGRKSCIECKFKIDVCNPTWSPPLNFLKMKPSLSNIQHGLVLNQKFPKMILILKWHIQSIKRIHKKVSLFYHQIFNLFGITLQ